MAGLKDLKNRLNSINSNKQITKAMQLVSTAKMKKAVNKQQEVSDYFNTILQSTDAIMSNLKNQKSIWLDNKKSGKKAYILLTSDLGLCGGFNQNVIKKFEDITKEEDKDNIFLIVLGKKGVDKLSFMKYNIDIKYINIMDASNSKISEDITEILLENYLNNSISEIHLVYTHFINALESEVKSLDLLPLNFEKHEFEKKSINSSILIEPDIESVLDSLVEQYVVGILYSTFVNSIASEQTARRNSMENATKNASELGENLTKKINQQRQAKITQEISEIVSGSESLKK